MISVENLVVGKSYLTKRSVADAITIKSVNRIDFKNKKREITRTVYHIRCIYIGQEHLGECPIYASMISREISLIERLEIFLTRRIKNIELKLANI